MVLFGSTFILVMVVAAECHKVNFPTSQPQQPSNKANGITDCIASNGQAGTCYEYNSNNFKECSYFPSIDLSIPSVKNHLTENVCKHTGRVVSFCCPSNHDPGVPAIDIPKGDECGIKLSDNVVGGTITSPGDWPWLAALGYKNGATFVQACGGTLITKQHVISAAHCFHSKTKLTTVRLGEYNIYKDEDEEQDFDIVDQREKNYNTKTHENDIILLKLDRTLSFTDSIRPACLPYHLRNDNFEGKRFIVVGWGIFDISDGRKSPVPNAGLVPVVPLQECQKKYIKLNGKIDEKQICAGSESIYACKGDNGGPINYIDFDDTERFYVVGVVSFGPTWPNGTCASNIPGVYTRIGHYLDWIEDSIREMQ